jgi:hypothetical protein
MTNTTKQDIPIAVLNTAKELIDMYGVNFDYLGRYKDADTYVYRFPEDSDTGFPFVYLLKDNSVTEVTGPIALHIIDLLDKDTED